MLVQPLDCAGEGARLGSAQGERDIEQATSAPSSTRANRRKRRPSLSTDELLDQALDIFLESGFDRTSIDTITATAGVAKRTVYTRYGDKKSLFRAALERAIDLWIVPEERLRQAELPDLEDTLTAIGQILVDNLLSPAGLRILRLTNAESVHMPEIGAYSVEHGTERTLAYLADLFSRRLQVDGQPCPHADDAAEVFLQMVVGGPANAAALGVVRDKEAIDRRIRFSVRLFLHGVSPEATGFSRPEPGSAEDDSSRLKKLLAEALLDLDRAREQLASRAPMPEPASDA